MRRNRLLWFAFALIGWGLQTAPSWGQVRKLHTRDLTRLSQIQVADYLKRSDIIFIPVVVLSAPLEWIIAIHMLPKGSPCDFEIVLIQLCVLLLRTDLRWGNLARANIFESAINNRMSHGAGALLQLLRSPNPFLESPARNPLFSL